MNFALEKPAKHIRLPADSYFPVSAYSHRYRARFVQELTEFIRFPSISVQPMHNSDTRRCAEWLADHLKKIGLEQVAVIPTRGHPVVYAEQCHVPAKPTVLIYGTL